MITQEEYLKARNIVRDYELQEKNRKEHEAQTVDKGLGRCKERYCPNYATTDYNGHGHYVCEYHDDKLNREFEEEYK